MEEQKVNNQYVIVLICGVPGSGKSTLSSLLHQNYFQSSIYIDVDKIERQTYKKNTQIDQELQQNIIGEQQNGAQLQEDLNKIGMDTNHFNDILEQLEKNKQLDEIQQKFDFDPIIWKQSRNVGLLLVERIISKPNQSNQIYIFIEDVFNLHSMRKNYLHLAQKYTTGFCEIKIQMSYNEVILSDSMRQDYKCVGENVIKKAFEQFDDDPLIQDQSIRITNTLKIQLEEIAESISQQIIRIGEKVTKQQTEITREEYAKILQENKENIIDQLNLKLNDKVGKIMKSPLYDILNNGGGEGLSVLKKLYFTAQKSYLSGISNCQSCNIEDLIMGLKEIEELKKKYLQKFKSNEKHIKFESVIRIMVEKMKGIEYVKQKNVERQENSINCLEDSSIDNKLSEKQIMIQQFTESSSKVFEDIIKILYEN